MCLSFWSVCPHVTVEHGTWRGSRRIRKPVDFSFIHNTPPYLVMTSSSVSSFIDLFFCPADYTLLVKMLSLLASAVVLQKVVQSHFELTLEGLFLNTSASSAVS